MRGRSPFVLALDEGTTGTSAVLFDADGRKVARSYREIPQFFPRPGWVEHDAQAILDASRWVLREVLADARVDARKVAALGITNQRETVVAWDGSTGRPLARAIVWQCRRTADLCARLKADGDEPWVRAKTGLLLDPYFSGSKIRWLVENNERVKQARRAGTLRFGTIDSWLLYRLSGRRVHATDSSNASRTLLMGLKGVRYEADLVDLFKAREDELPEIVDSSGQLATMDRSIVGREIPISGVAGDQQAALFGQACVRPGMTKNTYGTGCFALTNTGDRVPKPPKGIVATLAWRLRGRTTYALEGSVFVAGAVVQWLRDGLQVIESSSASEPLARAASDDGGVVFVPAFAGLGAPHWDPYARGAIFGLTRGTTKAHVARAALQAIALQSAEIVEALERGRRTGRGRPELRVDGGATENTLLLQYQADVLDRPVVRSEYAETTALGAAYLAGIGADVWKDEATIAALWRPGRRFIPKAKPAWRRDQWTRWREGVRRVEGWIRATQAPRVRSRRESSRRRRRA